MDRGTLVFLHTTYTIIKMSAVITKLRQPQFMQMAAFDWLATLAGAISIGTLIDHNSVAEIAGIFILMVIIAIIVHYSLGVPTMLNAYLGLTKKEDVYAARDKALRATSLHK